MWREPVDFRQANKQIVWLWLIGVIRHRTACERAQARAVVFDRLLLIARNPGALKCSLERARKTKNWFVQQIVRQYSFIAVLNTANLLSEISFDHVVCPRSGLQYFSAGLTSKAMSGGKRVSCPFLIACNRWCVAK